MWFVRFVERSGPEGQFDFPAQLLEIDGRSFVVTDRFSSSYQSQFCST